MDIVDITKLLIYKLDNERVGTVYITFYIYIYLTTRILFAFV